jgi:hypothetical protein
MKEGCQIYHDVVRGMVRGTNNGEMIPARMVLYWI